MSKTRAAGPRNGRHATADRNANDAQLKEAFRALHAYHGSFRLYVAYQKAIRDNPERAARWIAEFEEERVRQEALWRTRIQSALTRLRSARREASPLVAAFCALEGLDPLVVADAVGPPEAAPPKDSAHPWIATGSREHVERIGLADRWLAWPRVEQDQVVLRCWWDPRGTASVVQRGHSLELHCALGNALIGTSGGRARLTVQGAMPETLLMGARGRPVSDLVSHPLILDPKYRIVAASSDAGETIIEFACANVPWPPVGAVACAGPARLDVDPLRDGADAVQDLADRAALRVSSTIAALDEGGLLRNVRREVARINLCSPRMPPLPEPTIEQIRSAAAKLRRGDRGPAHRRR